MMGITRIIIGIICFGIILSIFNKHNIFNKKRKFICFIISIILIPTILSFVPFENLFVTFNSPKSVYNYVNYEKSNIKLIINGNNSDLVVGYRNGVFSHLIVPKTEKGWKIGISINNVRIIDKIVDNNIIHIENYKKTNDYYITVYNIDGKNLNIIDSSNSKFNSLEKETNITYYANIKNFHSNYWISINDKKIKLLENE